MPDHALRSNGRGKDSDVVLAWLHDTGGKRAPENRESSSYEGGNGRGNTPGAVERYKTLRRAHPWSFRPAALRAMPRKCA